MLKRVLFVVGASGSGKTSALQQLEQRRPGGVLIRYFDSIGVPTAEAMALTHGGPDAWQASATAAWIQRLVRETGELFVIEGQTRPSFVFDALGAIAAFSRKQLRLVHGRSEAQDAADAGANARQDQPGDMAAFALVFD